MRVGARKTGLYQGVDTGFDLCKLFTIEWPMNCHLQVPSIITHTQVHTDTHLTDVLECLPRTQKGPDRNLAIQQLSEVSSAVGPRRVGRGNLTEKRTTRMEGWRPRHAALTSRS